MAGKKRRGHPVSDETRAKMSEAQKGKRHSPETRAKIAAAALGHEVSDGTRAKLAAATRRRFEDQAERDKQSAALTGRSLSDEHKANIAAGQRGELNHNWGRVISDETRAAMASAARGRTGEVSNNWKGDDIQYDAAHKRAKRVLEGQPCAHADGTCKGRLECAFNHDTPPEFVKVGVDGPYSPRPEDYMSLCHSHHGRYDLESTKATA